MRIPSGFQFPHIPSIGQLGSKMLPTNITKIGGVAFFIFAVVCPGISYCSHTYLKGKQLKAIPDDRNYLQIIQDWHLANFREVYTRGISGKERMMDRLGFRKGYYLDPATSESVQWKNNSSCLVLCVHGLDGHPSDYAEYKRELEKDDRDVHLLYTFNGGHCSTKEGAEPILSLIKKYRQKFPNNPIILIGHSRGGPIVAYVEVELRKIDKDLRVYVGTIAGANNGSILMTLGRIFHVASWIFHPGLIEAIDFNQAEPQALISMQKEGDLSRRQLDYWATTGDFTVTPCFSGLPDIPDAQHTLVHDQGHTSVLVGVKEGVKRRVEVFLSKS